MRSREAGTVLRDPDAGPWASPWKDIAFARGLSIPTSFEKSFGFVEKGKPLVYNNELTRAALAVSQGSFTREFCIGCGPDRIVEFTWL